MHFCFKKYVDIEIITLAISRHVVVVGVDMRRP